MTNDWEIDPNISIWTLVFKVTRKNRELGRDVRLISGRASVGEPTDKSWNEHHDDEDLKKSNHDTVSNFRPTNSGG